MWNRKNKASEQIEQKQIHREQTSGYQREEGWVIEYIVISMIMENLEKIYVHMDMGIL